VSIDDDVDEGISLMTEAPRALAIATDVTKTFHTGKLEVPALRGLSLEVHEHDFLALVGPSGSGKTTLLNLLGALDRPTGGEVEVLGKKLSKLGKGERAKLRLTSLGFVFQAYNLVPVLSAAENVEFVLELQGVSLAERRKRALSVLADLGLADLADRRPSEMSGGQQQRVAVARAIASRPKLVLADEPTANLDTKSAEQLMDLMRKLHAEHGATFVFSTHDPRIVAHATRVVTLEDGRIVSDVAKEGSTANAA
jgi:putative ABC transport system ATP-binding protein